MTTTFHDLERRAIDAHRHGIGWKEFWIAHGDEVRRLAPYDRRRFRAIYNTLLCVVVSGDDSGREPPGTAPWIEPEGRAW